MMLITFFNASPPSVSNKYGVEGPLLEDPDHALVKVLIFQIRLMQLNWYYTFCNANALNLFSEVWLKTLTLCKSHQDSGSRGRTRNLQISNWRPEVCTQQDLQYRFCFIHSKCFYMEMFTHDVNLVKQKLGCNLIRPNKMLHQPKLIEFTIEGLIIEVGGSQSFWMN